MDQMCLLKLVQKCRKRWSGLGLASSTRTAVASDYASANASGRSPPSDRWQAKQSVGVDIFLIGRGALRPIDQFCRTRCVRSCPPLGPGIVPGRMLRTPSETPRLADSAYSLTAKRQSYILAIKSSYKRSSNGAPHLVGSGRKKPLQRGRRSGTAQAADRHQARQARRGRRCGRRLRTSETPREVAGTVVRATAACDTAGRRRISAASSAPAGRRALMYLIDVVVLSELRKPLGGAGLAAWV